MIGATFRYQHGFGQRRMQTKKLGGRNRPRRPSRYSTSQREAFMLQRGDILVERLTGKKAMIIDVPSSEVITCRFDDGRLEDRFTFEIAPAPQSFIDSVVSFARSLLWNNRTERRTQPVTTGTRPRLARQSGS